MSTDKMAEQVKSSAIRAGLFASIFFLACFLWDLPRRVLEQNLRMSWRMSIGLAGTLSGVIFAATFVSTFLGFRTSDCPKETSVRSLAQRFLAGFFGRAQGRLYYSFGGLVGLAANTTPF